VRKTNINKGRTGTMNSDLVSEFVLIRKKMVRSVWLFLVMIYKKVTEHLKKVRHLKKLAKIGRKKNKSKKEDEKRKKENEINDENER
jgi:hypothetical protein